MATLPVAERQLSGDEDVWCPLLLTTLTSFSAAARLVPAVLLPPFILAGLGG